MGTITTKDGVEIFYKDWVARDAQPLVFHHGWPLSATVQLRDSDRRRYRRRKSSGALILSRSVRELESITTCQELLRSTVP